ncbi:hypothetical protein FACS1894152_8120 [Bacilli bacterium]|nr:hypothetical protein FACS1894152_8120 [Bacilli bacterium]
MGYWGAGPREDKFPLHLKECEFIFNHRNLSKKEFESVILKLTRNYLKNEEGNKMKKEIGKITKI